MNQTPKPLVLATAIAVSLLAFLVTYGLAPHVWFVHLVLALLVGVVYGLVTLLLMQQNRPDENRFMPEEVLIQKTRYHPIQVIGGAVCGLGGVLLGLLSLDLWVTHKAVRYSLPHFTQQSQRVNVTVHHAAIAVWYLPAVISVLLLFMAVLAAEKWRCNWLILTNQRLIQSQALSPVVPFLVSRKFDPEQLNQIYDVDDYSMMWGSLFHWGTVALKVRTVTSADRDTPMVFHCVPHPQSFSDALRQASPIISRPPGSPIIPADPLDIPQPR